MTGETANNLQLGIDNIKSYLIQQIVESRDTLLTEITSNLGNLGNKLQELDNKIAKWMTKQKKIIKNS